MALVNCKECRAEISDRARACPKCGADRTSIASAINKTGGNVATIFLIIGVVIAILIAIAM